MNTKGLSQFFSENWKLAVGALAAVLVVIAGVGFWKARLAARENAATNVLYEVQKSARALVAQRKFSEAEKAFAPLFEQYAGTRAAYEANLQIGDLWMEAGTYPEAVKRYEQAASLAKEPFSQLLARYNVGIAQETAGQYQEAVNSYEQALNLKGSDFLRPEILMAQARCYEAMNQSAKAIALYQEVQTKFADRSYYSGAASAFEKQLGASQGSPQ